MPTRNKRAVWIAVIAALLASCLLTGCWDRRELDQIAIIVGAGVDLEDEDRVIVTLQMVRPRDIQTPGGGGGGNGQAVAIVLSGEGPTIWDAVQDVRNKISRIILWPHNQILIVGRAAAEAGIQPYIDFFMREPQVRHAIPIAVAENRASEILESTAEFEEVPIMELMLLIETGFWRTSQINQVSMHEFINALISETTDPTATFVIMDEENERALPRGTAVFKGDQFVGTLDERETRGLLWLTGEVSHGILTADLGETRVSAEVSHARVRLRPVLERGQPRFEVSVQVTSRMSSQLGPEPLATSQGVQLIAEKQNETVEGEIRAAWSKAQELGTDIFGLGDSIRRGHPRAWREGLKDKWEDIFPELELTVVVDSQIELIGNINQPATPER